MQFDYIDFFTHFVPPVRGVFRKNSPFRVGFVRKFAIFTVLRLFRQKKEGALYESPNSHRKPEKEDRASALDARLLLYVQLLADGIYLLFP